VKVQALIHGIRMQQERKTGCVEEEVLIATTTQ
jgi:hypothetical protein